MIRNNKVQKISIFLIIFHLIFFFTINFECILAYKNNNNNNDLIKNYKRINNNYLITNKYSKVNLLTSEIIAKNHNLKNINRNFFHLINVPYIICYFAAKGKWPFIPSFMQIQVTQVSRTIFTQTDNHIKNYCHNWFKIIECHRPDNYYQFDPIINNPQTQSQQPATTMMTTTTTINTDVETFDPNSGNDDDDNNNGNGDDNDDDNDNDNNDEDNDGRLKLTPCTCGTKIKQKIFIPTKLPSGLIFFNDDNNKNPTKNITSETILNVIEFLENFILLNRNASRNRNNNSNNNNNNNNNRSNNNNNKSLSNTKIIKSKIIKETTKINDKITEIYN